MTMLLIQTQVASQCITPPRSLSTEIAVMTARTCGPYAAFSTSQSQGSETMASSLKLALACALFAYCTFSAHGAPAGGDDAALNAQGGNDGAPAQTLQLTSLRFAFHFNKCKILCRVRGNLILLTLPHQSSYPETYKSPPTPCQNHRRDGGRRCGSTES